MRQDILSKMDRYFESKKPSESNIIFFGAALVISYLIYMLCFEPAQNFFNEKLDRHTRISAKLENTKDYLASVSSPDGEINFKINEENKNLSALKLHYTNILKFNSYFDSKLKELSFLLFDNQNWASYIDSIVLLAKKNNIKILELKSDIKEPNFQKVEQILNIDITCIGNFKDMLSYINGLEESKLVVDLHKMDINSTQRDLGAKLSISVWGMKY